MHDTCDDTDVVHVRRIDCDCQRSCGMLPVHKHQALLGQHNTKQQLAPLWNSTLSGQTSSGEGTDDKLSRDYNTVLPPMLTISCDLAYLT